jgi:hypothetical protein
MQQNFKTTYELAKIAKVSISWKVPVGSYKNKNAFIYDSQLGTVVYFCNSSYSGGKDWKDHASFFNF